MVVDNCLVCDGRGCLRCEGTGYEPITLGTLRMMKDFAEHILPQTNSPEVRRKGFKLLPGGKTKDS